MKQTAEPLITPDVLPENLRRLAAQVCLQAVRDVVYSKDARRKLDALLFLTSPEFEVWADWGNNTFTKPYQLLSNLRTVKKQLRLRSV